MDSPFREPQEYWFSLMQANHSLLPQFGATIVESAVQPHAKSAAVGRWAIESQRYAQQVSTLWINAPAAHQGAALESLRKQTRQTTLLPSRMARQCGLRLSQAVLLGNVRYFNATPPRRQTLTTRLVTVLACCLWASAGICRESHWPETLTIGTASPGGTYFVYGEGLARILTRELRTTVWARSTEGPSENIKLLEAGEIQLGFVTLGIAQQGWNGTGDWTEGKQFRAMRAVFPMYDTPFQFMVLRDSGLLTISDLSGKRVGIGPAGGTTGTYIPEFFKSLKIDARFQNGTWAELASKVQDGSLDGLAVGAGVPFPSFAELERKTKVRYLPLSPDQIVALRQAMPELGPSVVAAGTYPSLLRHYQTVGLFNFAVAHLSLPDDLVYAIADAVFTYHEEMMGVHPAAAETVPASFTRNTFLPFHTGAAEWYHRKASTGVVRGD